MPENEKVETQVDNTTNNETEPIVEKEQVENTTDPKLPTTEEELSKLLQSSSSKAKGEILKELGYKSVKDIKEAIAKGNNVEELNSTITNLTKEREALEAERNELKGTLLKRDNKKILRENGVPEELAETFLTFVDNNVQEGETREEAARRVKNTLFKAAGIEVKIGVDKTKDSGDAPINEKLVADLRKGMKLSK